MEPDNESGEWLLLAYEEQVADQDSFIETDDLSSTATANSDEHKEQIMLMCGRDNYHARIIKPPTIPYEGAKYTPVDGKQRQMQQRLSAIDALSRKITSYRIASTQSPPRIR